MSKKIKVAIFGAGSVGCYLGGQLVHGGCEVVFIGREGFQKIILKHSLTLTHFSRDDIKLDVNSFHYSVEPSLICDVDIILVTVKSQDTEQAAKILAAHIKPKALVISFQNGVSNVGVLKQTLTNHLVLGGVVPFNITSSGPGKFHCGVEGDLSVESGSDKLKFLSSAFLNSGQKLNIYDDILAIQWGKLLVNLNNALNTLTGRTLLNGFNQQDYRKALIAIVSEGLSIVRNSGVEPANFGKTSPDKFIKIMKLPNFIYKIIMNKIVKIDKYARSSMLDDLEMGRNSEVDYLQGAIVDLAKTMGQKAPYNKRILELVNQAFDAGVSPKLSGTQICQELGL